MKPTRQLYPELKSYLLSTEDEYALIAEERRTALKQLVGLITQTLKTGTQAKLIFICTHNSRRSHLSQIWAATAAYWHGMKGIKTFSGGTETTAFNPRAVATLKRAGFRIEDPDGENPRYQVAFSPDVAPMTCFSKVYTHRENPQTGFIAVMTCSQADADCPVVRGAAHRFALSYEDPKIADDTPEETARYDERCRQIAREMLFLFGEVETILQADEKKTLL